MIMFPFNPLYTCKPASINIILICFQACNDFLSLAQAYEKKFLKSLNLEREKRRRLEDTVETLAKQHNKLEQVCKYVDIRSMSMVNLHNQNSQVARSPGGSIEHEDDDEDDHDEFFDAMSEHPEAFGMTCKEDTMSDFIDQSGNDPYSDIDESSETFSMSSAVDYPTEKMQNTDVAKEAELKIRRTASEKVLDSLSQQEIGHRRAVSYDLRGQITVSLFLLSVFLRIL